MKFQDLTEHDLFYLKSTILDLYLNDKLKRDRYALIVEGTLLCFKSKGYRLIPEIPKIQLVLEDAVKPDIFRESRKDPVLNEVVKSIFGYLLKNNIELQRDETLLEYWPVPKPSWYHPYTANKKPWMF